MVKDFEQAFQFLIDSAVEKAIEKHQDKLQQAALDKGRLYSVTELSKYSRFSEVTIRSWILRDYDPLPAFQVGKEYRVHLNVFLEWLERYRVAHRERVEKLVRIEP
jgi:hypothetical protein